MDMKGLWLHVLFWLSIWIFKAIFQFTLNRDFYAHLSLPEQIYYNFLPEFFLTWIKMGVCYRISYFYKDHNWKFDIGVIGKIVAVFVIGIILRQLFLSIYIDFYNPSTPLVNQNVLFDPSRILNSIIDNGFVLGFFLILKNHQKQLQWARREQNLIRENLETELNFLRSQVNPHFLFNTLNNFYSMAQNFGHVALADSILRLSDLMRYSLYESNSRMITGAREIAYIKSYINLTKLRFEEDEVNVDFQYNEAATKILMPPMILVPLVENALKYGVSVNKKSSIYITVTACDGELTFTCVNPKYNSGQTNDELKGIGLSNVRRRLDLIYPGKHKFEIANTSESYSVTLTIWEND